MAGGHVWQGALWWGACMAGGMQGRAHACVAGGVHEGACVAGGMHGRGGAWQGMRGRGGGVHGGPAWWGHV